MQELQQLTLRVADLARGNNPRTFFDVEEMAQLEESIKAKGVIQPILVRQLEDGTMRVVAGERRWRAAKKVHGDDYQIPALIREMSDEEEEELALIENVNRANMSPTEEAEAAAKVLGRCNGDRDEAARRLGWSRATLDKRLALMNCSDKVRKALTERKIQLGHAELFAAAPKDKQDAVLEKILSAPTLVPVVQFKAQLESISRAMSSAIFDKSDCAGCIHNSGNQQALFAEAVSDGHCTNGGCFDTKTMVALEEKKTLLEDEYPRVVIVNPGDNKTLIKLVAEGETGVGEEQAKACKTCQNFGAAVSNVPGKVGLVAKNQCFDPACHSKKLAARIKAEKATSDEPKSGPSGSKAEGDKKVKAGISKAEAKVQDSQRVKDYRLKVWRSALQKELFADRAKNLTVLLAISVAGYARHIDSAKLSQAFNKLFQVQPDTSDLIKVATVVEAGNDEARQKLFSGLAASVAGNIEEARLVELLRYMGTDLGQHWTLCTEFLDLLTKTEIEALTEELGIKSFLGDKYSKAMSGKKADIIKALLEIEGFDYAGKVPRAMDYNQ